MDRHPIASSTQRGGSDEAIAAIVPGPAQHMNMTGARDRPTRDDRAGHRHTGALHGVEARQAARERSLLGSAHLRSGQQRQIGVIARLHRSAHLAEMRKVAS